MLRAEMPAVYLQSDEQHARTGVTYLPTAGRFYAGNLQKAFYVTLEVHPGCDSAEFLNVSHKTHITPEPCRDLAVITFRSWI